MSSALHTPKIDKLIGKQLGVYQIIEAIGQGRMARVYKGYHADLDRYAAIKVISWGLSEDETFTERFRQEARAIAGLRHPAIAAIYDFGKYDQGYYLAMEYIDGEDLEQFIAREQNISPANIQSIISDIAAALDHVHLSGVIHRDLKPSNIILAKNGQAILTDFGLAMLPSNLGATTLSSGIGAPYYMAPEQAISAAAATAASDIYSLGVILFEFITGARPYEADAPLDVALKHINASIPNAQDLAPETPGAVNVVIQKAMAKKPEARFNTAAEMAQTLSNVWDTSELPLLKSGSVRTVSLSAPTRMTISPQASSPVETLPTWRKHAKWLWGAATLLVLTALSIGVWFSLQRPEPTLASLTPTQASVAIVGTSANTPTATPVPLATETPAQSEGIVSALPSPTIEASPSPTAIPTPEPTATPTVTPTPTPPPPPTLTPTAAPTEPALSEAEVTLVPVFPTATPTPTNTPTTEELLDALYGKILFKTDRAGRVEIYQMNPDGSGQEPLEPERAYLYNEAVRWEAFSPDRQETIVARGEAQIDLWRANITSGSEARVTNNPAPDYDPVWSPTDNRIIFVSDRTGSGDLYIRGLDQVGEDRLTMNEEDFDKHPSWSPDGKNVVFWSDRGWEKNWQVWVFNLETSEEINLSNNIFRDWDPVWVK